MFKIVSGNAEPIPNMYSAQLKRIVTSMLAKDANVRISVQDVMRDPYVLNFMQHFVDSDGQNIKKPLTVRKTGRNSDESHLNETPKERMQRLKREKADEEFEKMKRATRDAFVDNKL